MISSVYYDVLQYLKGQTSLFPRWEQKARDVVLMKRQLEPQLCAPYLDPQYRDLAKHVGSVNGFGLQRQQEGEKQPDEFLHTHPQQPQKRCHFNLTALCRYSISSPGEMEPARDAEHQTSQNRFPVFPASSSTSEHTVQRKKLLTWKTLQELLS